MDLIDTMSNGSNALKLGFVLILFTKCFVMPNLDPLEMRFGNCNVLKKNEKLDANTKRPKEVVMDHDNAAYIVGTCQVGTKNRRCPGKWVCVFLKE